MDATLVGGIRQREKKKRTKEYVMTGLTWLTLTAQEDPTAQDSA